MKYLSFVLVSFFVFETQSMENKKPRRDCCYLAEITKNIMWNVPGAIVYTGAEYAANTTIFTLSKLQTILEVSQDTKQKDE